MTSLGRGGRLADASVPGGGTPASRWHGWQDRVPALDLATCPGLVVVGAHPDDETLGLGGLIASLTEAGVPVDIVTASDGAGAYPGLSALDRTKLKRVRRAELAEAARVLGTNAPVNLDVPDGEVSDYEAWLASHLTTILQARPTGVWCAATWRGDGHPDHEAVGRAARFATRSAGAVLLEYPVWMWHWAVPEDFAIPWWRACSVPVTDEARRRKQVAIAGFGSQLTAPDGYDPILPSSVVDRLLTVGEVVFCDPAALGPRRQTELKQVVTAPPPVIGRLDKPTDADPRALRATTRSTADSPIRR